MNEWAGGWMDGCVLRACCVCVKRQQSEARRGEAGRLCGEGAHLLDDELMADSGDDADLVSHFPLVRASYPLGDWLISIFNVSPKRRVQCVGTWPPVDLHMKNQLWPETIATYDFFYHIGIERDDLGCNASKENNRTIQLSQY